MIRFLLLLLLPLCLFARKPVLLLVKPYTQGLEKEQERQLLQALELSFSQSDYFILISSDELKQKYTEAGFPSSPQCRTEGCLWEAGSILKADLVVGSFARMIGDSLLLDLKLYGMKEEAVIRNTRRKEAYSETQSILLTSRNTVQQLVGFVADSKMQFQDIPAVTQNYPLWGAIVLTGGVALYTSWKWLDFNGKDSQEESPDSIAIDDDIALSGLRGFFASTPPDAKSRALGGAVTARVKGAESSLWNPAGLTKLTQKEWQIGRVELMEGLYKDFTVFASPIGQNVFQAHGVFVEGDDLAKEVRYFSSWATDLSPWSLYLRSVSIGANFALYQVSVGDECNGEDCVTGSAIGGGLDLGIQWKLQKEFSLGIFLQDVYSSLYYNNAYTNRKYEEGIPTLLTFGVAWEGDAMMISADWQKGLYADQQDHFRVGLEKTMWSFLALRGGLQELEDLRVWSAGFGLEHQEGLYGIGIHYAYEYSEMSFWQHNQSFMVDFSF